MHAYMHAYMHAVCMQKYRPFFQRLNKTVIMFNINKINEVGVNNYLDVS